MKLEPDNRGSYTSMYTFIAAVIVYSLISLLRLTHLFFSNNDTRHVRLYITAQF